MKTLEANHRTHLDLAVEGELERMMRCLLAARGDCIGEDEQDRFFPVPGNRSAMRRAFNIRLQELNATYALEVTVTSNTTETRSLARVYLERQSADPNWSGYSRQQRTFAETGIREMKSEIKRLPIFLELEETHALTVESVSGHLAFSQNLARGHALLQENAISSLQSAASALESNAWIARSLGSGIGALNVALENVIPMPPVEQSSDKKKK